MLYLKIILHRSQSITVYCYRLPFSFTRTSSLFFVINYQIIKNGVEDNISFFIWLELVRFCCPKPQADGNRSFKGQTKLLLYSRPVYKIFVINRQFFQNCFIPLTTIFTCVKTENLNDVIYYTFVIVTSKCRDFLKQWK